VTLACVQRASPNPEPKCFKHVKIPGDTGEALQFRGSHWQDAIPQTLGGTSHVPMHHARPGRASLAAVSMLGHPAASDAGPAAARSAAGLRAPRRQPPDPTTCTPLHSHLRKFISQLSDAMSPSMRLAASQSDRAPAAALFLQRQAALSDHPGGHVLEYHRICVCHAHLQLAQPNGMLQCVSRPQCCEAQTTWVAAVHALCRDGPTGHPSLARPPGGRTVVINIQCVLIGHVRSLSGADRGCADASACTSALLVPSSPATASMSAFSLSAS